MVLVLVLTKATGANYPDIKHLGPVLKQVNSIILVVLVSVLAKATGANYPDMKHLGPVLQQVRSISVDRGWITP